MNILSNSATQDLSNEELFLISNYKQCPVHPKRKLTCISTDPTSKYYLKCLDCITLSADKNFLPLLSVLDSDNKTIFKSWPVINDSEFYDELVDISQRKSFAEDTKEQIKCFFKQFRAQIDLVLEEKQIEMINHTDSLWNINEKVLNQYNQLCVKEELKEIITNKKDSFDQQNKILGETIQRVLHNQEGSKKAILSSINHLKNQMNTIDFQFPNQLKQKIIQQIKEIDLFLVKNLGDIRIDKSDQKSSLKNILKNVKPAGMTTSQLIMKLMNNKLNNCSEQLLDQLNNTIQTVEGYLDKTVITGISQEEVIELDKLQEEQIKNMKQLAQYFLQDQCYEDKSPNLINKKQNLMKLIDNKLNFCSQRFLNQFSSILDKYHFILQEIDFSDSSTLQNDAHPISFEHLNDKQLKNISILIRKMSQLSQQFGNDYQNGQSPSKNRQPNSYQINTCLISNKYFLSKKEFSQLLNDYPICELSNLQFQSKYTTLNLDFIQTNYQDSQQLKIERMQEGKIIIIQQKSLSGQIATQSKLDVNTNYIFRCKLNRKLNVKNYIDFGIMKSSNIHTHELYKEKCCYETNSKDYGLDSIMQGKNLSEVRSEIDCVEVRVNIGKRILMYADYPNYGNINSTHADKIEQNCEYSFGVRFGNPGQNIVIEVESLTTVDNDAFSQFS